MSNRTLQILLAAGTLVLIAGFTPFAQAVDSTIEGQVTIVGTNCGLGILGAPIQYGSLSFGQESAEQVTSINNTGTTDGQLEIRGNNWKDTITQNVEMVVGATHWSASAGMLYNDMNTLTDTSQPTGITLVAGAPLGYTDLNWKLKADLANAAYTGDAMQIVTLSIFC